MRLILALRKKAHYGWAIFGLSFINLTVEGGIKNSEPVFFVALLNTFGAGAAATGAARGPPRHRARHEQPGECVQ